MLILKCNVDGEAHFISLISRTVVHKYHFKRPVPCIKFSPDGKHIAVCKESNGMCYMNVMNIIHYKNWL